MTLIKFFLSSLFLLPLFIALPIFSACEDNSTKKKSGVEVAENISEDKETQEEELELPEEKQSVKFTTYLTWEDSNGTISSFREMYQLSEDEGILYFEPILNLYKAQLENMEFHSKTFLLRVVPHNKVYYPYLQYLEATKNSDGTITYKFTDLLDGTTVRYDGGWYEQCQIIVQTLLNEDLNLTDQKVSWSRETKEGRKVYLSKIDNPYKVKIYILDRNAIDDEVNLTITSSFYPDENETITSLYRIKLRHTGIIDDSCLLNENNQWLFEEIQAEDKQRHLELLEELK
jgi:hypothetical protein